MANITLHIAGRNYPITCGDGEEDHARSLAKSLDSKISEATNGQSVTETRALLFGGLMLADSLRDAEVNIKKSEKALAKAIKAVKESEMHLAQSEADKVKNDVIAAKQPDVNTPPEPQESSPGALTEATNDAMIANAVKALDQLAERIEELADRIETAPSL